MTVGGGILKGYKSSLGFPSPFQNLASFTTSPYSSTSSLAIRIPGTSNNLVDISVKFRSYTSSNTCNPYAIAFLEFGSVYPYTGQYILADYNVMGTLPGWNFNTYGYYSSVNPGTTDSRALAATLNSSSNVSYGVYFVFNDVNVEIDGEIEIVLYSQGPLQGIGFLYN